MLAHLYDVVLYFWEEDEEHDGRQALGCEESAAHVDQQSNLSSGDWQLKARGEGPGQRAGRHRHPKTACGPEVDGTQVEHLDANPGWL